MTIQQNKLLTFIKFYIQKNGYSPTAAIAIDIDTYASELQRNFFGNSATLSGILYSDGTLTQEQYDRIRANWDNKYKGVQNAHIMAILEGGLKFQPLTPTSRDMQYIDELRTPFSSPGLLQQSSANHPLPRYQ